MFKEYPYVNLTDLNLDYMYRMLKDMEKRLSDYVKQSTITFHDPITWDITDQYTVNTMVVDTDGTAYLSVQPVPAGIDITDTDYWQPIFNYDDNINKLMSNITVNTRTTGVLPEARSAGSLAWFDGTLYMVNADLASGSVIQPGVNATAITLEDWIELMRTALENADTALGGRIDQEILDRQAADITLGSADTALGGRIDQEILDRQAADNALGGRIDQEILDRQSADNGLGTRIDNMEMTANKRRYILLGDSYGYGIVGGGAPWGTGWLEYCKNTLNNDVYYFDPASSSVEGNIGFTSSLPFVTVLQQIAQQNDLGDPDTITDIVVIGGNNDSGLTPKATILTAIAAFCTYARSIYRKAEISIGVLGYNVQSNYDIKQMYDTYKSGALANGCKFLSDILLLPMNPTYYSDGTHITATGYDYINPYVMEAVLTGGCHYTYEFESDLVPDTTKLNPTSGQVMALRVYVNEKGFQAALVRKSSYTGWFCSLAAPTTSGTLTLADAFTFSGNAPKLPRQYYALGGVDRIGVMNGSNGVVGIGSYYLVLDKISINAGFYHANGITPTSQLIMTKYPVPTQFID